MIITIRITNLYFSYPNNPLLSFLFTYVIYIFPFLPFFSYFQFSLTLPIQQNIKRCVIATDIANLSANYMQNTQILQFPTILAKEPSLYLV